MSSGKTVVVMLQSLAGTGQKIFRQRPKIGDKLEFLYYDQFVRQTVLFREVKKMKTLRSKSK
uniref:Large ribosomal subunit protein bL33m n=1 Tax=Arion vulgaris TaxID=1028688 RepID=A0A0B6ZCJ7_9EUPU